MWTEVGLEYLVKQGEAGQSTPVSQGDQLSCCNLTRLQTARAIAQIPYELIAIMVNKVPV